MDGALRGIEGIHPTTAFLLVQSGIRSFPRQIIADHVITRQRFQTDILIGMNQLIGIVQLPLRQGLGVLPLHTLYSGRQPLAVNPRQLTTKVHDSILLVIVFGVDLVVALVQRISVWVALPLHRDGCGTDTSIELLNEHPALLRPLLLQSLHDTVMNTVLKVAT